MQGRLGLLIGLLLTGLLLIGTLPIGFCASDTVQAAELSDIRDRGYLIVGVKENLRPLGFRDPQTQELQGFEIDIARQLAAELLADPTALELQPLLNQDRLKALLTDQVDLIVARMSITPARLRVVDFSPPYYIDGTALIARDPALQQLSDLQPARVAVLNGSDTIATVRSLLPALSLRGVETYAEAETLLESGQVDAFAADVTVLTGWVQQNPAYHLLPTLLSAEALAVAMPKGLQFDTLRQPVNQAIERWRVDGWLRQRIRTWGLPRAGLPGFVE
ncbi:MAG: transporter substrate-binding domain-containing protein [Elainella sp. Prado103]|nr:transporter substrate-binding domain-containing protein [Elainella sp. Prado103]